MINSERDLLINEITEILIKTEPEMVTLKDKEKQLTAKLKACKDEF